MPRKDVDTAELPDTRAKGWPDYRLRPSRYWRDLPAPASREPRYPLDELAALRFTRLASGKLHFNAYTLDDPAIGELEDQAELFWGWLLVVFGHLDPVSLLNGRAVAQYLMRRETMGLFDVALILFGDMDVAEQKFELVPRKQLEDIRTIDALAKQARSEIAKAEHDGDDTMKGLLVAGTMQMLRERLTDDLLTSLTALQNSPLGFRTDNQKGYPVEVVRDAFIEATIRGARMVGNEVNILSGRLYLTREYYERAVRELPGVTDLFYEHGACYKVGDNDKEAAVEMWATWRENNKLHRYDAIKTTEGNTVRDRRIVVRVNSGQGVDAIRGKATRKFLAIVYKLICGHSLDVDDPDDPTGTITIEPADIQVGPATEEPASVAGGVSPEQEIEFQFSEMKTIVECEKLRARIDTENTAKHLRDAATSCCAARKKQIREQREHATKPEPKVVAADMFPE